jgi:hypothetical protein
MWGMWGDMAISLIQRDFQAPHNFKKYGESPHILPPISPQNDLFRVFSINRGLFIAWSGVLQLPTFPTKNKYTPLYIFHNQTGCQNFETDNRRA